MSANSQQPIGIFDSGVGGLTIANAITKKLPNEDIVYFGDTAHLPYGDKSKKTIRNYSAKIVSFLLEKRCKIIVVACNSASAQAFKQLEKTFQNAIIVDVISPLIQYLKNKLSNTCIGVIGTIATIESGVYQQEISSIKNLDIKTLATPLLVPLIEQNFNPVLTKKIIHDYLNSKPLSNINHLVLGCTHYPLIKKEFEEFYKNKVSVIDSPSIMGLFVANLLQEKRLYNKNKAKGKCTFFVSDLTSNFELNAKSFFQDNIVLTECKL